MLGAFIAYKRANLVGICTRNYSLSRVKYARTYYEILGLKESCTNEEIKEAFYKKMKLLHPDRNEQSSKNHKLAVEVNEAYSVLGKTYSRNNYDYDLSQLRAYSRYNSIKTDIPRDRVIFRDQYNFYQDTSYRYGGYERDDDNYYGIKGVKRLPNGYVAAIVVLFAIFGAIFHVFVTSITVRYSLKRLAESDEKARLIYKSVREQAMTNGTEKQIELLLNHRKTELDKESKKTTMEEK